MQLSLGVNLVLPLETLSVMWVFHGLVLSTQHCQEIMLPKAAALQEQSHLECWASILICLFLNCFLRAFALVYYLNGL